MSRSYHHNPEHLNYGGDTSYKKIFNRRLRRSSKCEDIPSGSAYKKMNCSWEIYDVKDYYTENDYVIGSMRYDKNISSEDEARKTYKKHYVSK